MRSWQELKQSGRNLAKAVLLGEYLAGINKHSGAPLHRSPPETLLQECQGAGGPWVAGQGIGMSPLQNLGAKVDLDKQTVNRESTGA